MAKLKKPIAVEAEANDAEAKEVVIEPSDIVGGIKLEDAAEENADKKSDVLSAEEEEEAKMHRRGEVKPLKKKKDNKKKSHGGRNTVITLICVAVVAALLSLWVIYDNNQLEKTFYQVKSSKVTDNIRVVCLSDLHLKEFGEDNERLVYEVSKLSPDIITLVGDMNVEQQPDNYASVLSLCKQLGEVAPLYYSLGNHELDAMLFGGSQIYKDAKKQGIHILNDETETINIKGTDIDVIGLTQNPLEFEEFGKEFTEKTLAANDNFKLLMIHYPEMFMGVLDDYAFDLALAGHAHGGQVRLPWIGGLYSADQGFFPQLCDGYHEIGDTKLVITRGLGKSGWCPRINNTPEIMVVDLGWY